MVGRTVLKKNIKKEVLNRIKETIELFWRKIIKWIDNAPAYQFEPCILDEDKEEIDVEQICDKKISEVIDFLSL